MYKKVDKGEHIINGEGWVPAPPRPMNLITWNCQGLGNHRVVQELLYIVQEQGPMIVFWSKTWLDRDRMEWI